MDPAAPFMGKFFREYVSLNNKCMELRKVRWVGGVGRGGWGDGGGGG
jgi:hypothetical protein